MRASVVHEPCVSASSRRPFNPTAASEVSRRDFLVTTAAATAFATGALVLDSSGAGSLPAETRPGKGLIDTNVTLGRWPFRQLPLDKTTALVARLRHQGVTQAWAGSFEALFPRDLATANAQLAEECRRDGCRLLLPFGSVNLTLPDWEEDFRRCVGPHAMRGLRLFPTYHGYELADPAFAKLLALAGKQKIVVQIAADLEDERTQHRLAQVPHLDANPLLALVRNSPGGRVELLNWQRAVKPDLVKQLAAAGVCFDIATVEGVGGVANLIEQISPNRVGFGSHAPFFYLESALLKLKESALDSEPTRAVCELNARRLLA
jgi:predicted TIM-barrel fold metal-dependent hydrolase